MAIIKVSSAKFEVGLKCSKIEFKEFVNKLKKYNKIGKLLIWFLQSFSWQTHKWSFFASKLVLSIIHLSTAIHAVLTEIRDIAHKLFPIDSCDTQILPT